MTPERWQRISAAFAAAQRLAPDQRAAYLEAALGGHPEDRREVEALLAGHASGFLEAATGAAGAPALGPGDRFGRYRIVHELGRGVYLAEDTELDRRAALKVLATGPGRPSCSAITWFERRAWRRASSIGASRPSTASRRIHAASPLPPSSSGAARSAHGWTKDRSNPARCSISPWPWPRRSQPPTRPA
jgi:hypothetical protein